MKLNKYYNLIFLMALTSACNQRQTAEIKMAQPNILIIVADDMGFSDIEPFGSGLSTPTLSQLSKEALRFSNFHVLPTCSPTRASLLTGNDNHVAGFGIMTELEYPTVKNLPGYSGHLTDQVVTIPELLQQNGYHTLMTGKWHLGEGVGYDPYNRGFEETFILGTGGGSHYSDMKALSPMQHMAYTRNGKEVELPSDFYSTRNYTDSMIQFIDKHKADGKPFLGYLSYTAPHDPLHAPEEYIKKYKGKFDGGWDSLRMARLNNLKAIGLFPNGVNGFAPNPMVPKWETLSKEQQADFSRDMEVYAAMIDYVDMSIGRVLDYLKDNGMYENTLILFMSDNGANGAVATTYPGNGDGKYLSAFNNEMENRGLPGSYIEMGPGWAQAVSSPFRLFKTFTTEGGIKAPMMIKAPAGTKNAGQWNHSFVHVTDIMPTLLELTGAAYPQQFKGKNIHPLIGKSILPILNGHLQTVHENDGMGYELFEMKAFIKGKYKILRLPQPFSTGVWQLFDLENDPAETNDLSDKFPEVREDLINDWMKYSKLNDVFDHNGHYDSLYRKSYGGE
ncbi:MAG TPA: arylsulfatase [Chryseolinea sp.]|nr:arylsulfatase [Chryseolinea sp.]